MADCNKGRFTKGGKPGPGRPAGAKNKLHVKAAAAIEQALNYGGGAVKYLVKMRDSRTASDRAAFLHLVGKLVPHSLGIEVEGIETPPVVVVLPWNGRGPRPGQNMEDAADTGK